MNHSFKRTDFTLQPQCFMLRVAKLMSGQDYYINIEVYCKLHMEGGDEGAQDDQKKRNGEIIQVAS